jgi:hypothetical protein
MIATAFGHYLKRPFKRRDPGRKREKEKLTSKFRTEGV